MCHLSRLNACWQPKAVTGGMSSHATTDVAVYARWLQIQPNQIPGYIFKKSQKIFTCQKPYNIKIQVKIIVVLADIYWAAKTSAGFWLGGVNAPLLPEAKKILKI